MQGARLRKGLVTFQFAVTATLIIAALVVQRQLGYLQTRDLGYDTEQVVQLPLAGELRAQAETFKREAGRLASVAKASLASGIPGRGGFVSTVEADGETHQVRYLVADPDYLATMGMAVRAGRPFDSALASDSSGFLVNETGARQLGLTDQLGRPDALPVWMGVSKPLGIVEDFHTASLREPIMTTVILMDPSWYRTLVLRLRKGRVAEALAELETVWSRIEPDEPFRYTFLDEVVAEQYAAERRLRGLFAAFTLLALFVACLGLLGLAAFTAEQRTKEIGIRKVLGASVTSIVALLSKDFVRLVLVALALAIPVAYLAMQRWLEGFAYRVELGPGVFLLAGALALLVALVTVGYQAFRAARLDPVQSLRSE